MAGLVLRQRENVKPILQALLVADHVYRDATTGKYVVAGVFHSIRLTNQPTRTIDASPGAAPMTLIPVPLGGHRAGSPFCYLSLTEVRGEQHFVLRYVDLSSDKPLFQTSFGIKCDDPVATCEMAFPLPSLPAERAGTFALEMLWNDEPLGLHRITVEHSENKGQENGN